MRRKRPRPAGIRHTQPRALRHQLVTVLVVVVLLVTGALALTSTIAVRSQLTSRLDEQLQQSADRLHRPVPPGELNGSSANGGSTGTGGAGDPGTTSDGTTPSPTPPRYRPFFGQEAGTIMVTPGYSGYLTQKNVLQPLTEAQKKALTAVPDDGKPHDVDVPDLGSYRAITTTTSDGEPATVAISTQSVTETVQRYLLIELGLGAIGVIVAAVLGAWLVRRALHPLDEVAAAASGVSELELSEGEPEKLPRLDSRFTDERTEVGQVGAALNRMLDNVDTSLAARHASEIHVRQFVADASHELRTPLASIRGYAELVRRSPDVVPPNAQHALDRIESESGRMSALVEDLLLLARLDAGRPLEKERVDLTEIALEALGDAHAAGPDHHWHLDLPWTGHLDDDDAGDDSAGAEPGADGDGAGTGDDSGFDAEAEPVEFLVTGDEARLRQVITNLLANARVHTPAGTSVTLGLRGSEDGAVVVSVSDDGPGIPEELRATLFQRFVRGDAARNRVGGSTGLGLAIAQSIVQAHGGSISVSERDGGGTVFEVRLPKATDE